MNKKKLWLLKKNYPTKKKKSINLKIKKLNWDTILIDSKLLNKIKEISFKKK